MAKELEAGLKHVSEKIVQQSDTATVFGSGDMSVFSTPMMVGLMENAAMKAVGDYLEEGCQTVGIHLDIKHLAATPVGMKVRAEAELVEVKGKQLVFKVEAYDEKEKIGEGIHRRFIVDKTSFMEKTQAKAKK
ncbi:MAG: thioesterase [delta proteobacterium ML8_F1]|nr:MAG: thioesterase [delta proteobacterium ML8_F1]